MANIPIIDFIRKESDESGVTLLIMSALSGIANGLLLAIVTTAVSSANGKPPEFRYLAMYALAILGFVLGKRYAMIRANTVVEKIICKIRTRVANQIRQSQLLTLEDIGNAEIYTRITRDTESISQSAFTIINAMQSAIMVLFCIFYMLYLSVPAFLVSVGLIAVAILIYTAQRKQIIEELQEAIYMETEFFEKINHFLAGFKEIKINEDRSNDLFDNHLTVIAKKTEALKIKTAVTFVKNFLFSQAFFYILIAVIVFLLPVFIDTYNSVIIKTTTAILFMMGPLELLVGSVPIVAKANVSILNLYKLEKMLKQELQRQTEYRDPVFVPQRPSFKNAVRFENIKFHYTDAKTGKPLFGVGPFNFEVNKGETLFVVGGNGSGKSTMVKLLTGLYYPTEGTLKLDDNIINEYCYREYRSLFSIIFTDFHLFDRLYGMKDVDREKFRELLGKMELEGKTDLMKGRFTNINLSTGQKKRLALIVTYLEDRPIYVFDEWAADQDPQFRKHFYNVMLKDLKAQGKTIIAVTHDDHYFKVADRIIKMEYGKIEKIVKGEDLEGDVGSIEF